MESPRTSSTHPHDGSVHAQLRDRTFIFRFQGKDGRESLPILQRCTARSQIDTVEHKRGVSGFAPATVTSSTGFISLQRPAAAGVRRSVTTTSFRMMESIRRFRRTVSAGVWAPSGESARNIPTPIIKNFFIGNRFGYLLRWTTKVVSLRNVKLHSSNEGGPITPCASLLKAVGS